MLWFPMDLHTLCGISFALSVVLHCSSAFVLGIRCDSVVKCVWLEYAPISDGTLPRTLHFVTDAHYCTRPVVG